MTAFMASHKKDLKEAQLAVELAKEEAVQPHRGGHLHRGRFDIVEQGAHNERVIRALARIGLQYT